MLDSPLTRASLSCFSVFVNSSELPQGDNILGTIVGQITAGQQPNLHQAPLTMSECCNSSRNGYHQCVTIGTIAIGPPRRPVLTKLPLRNVTARALECSSAVYVRLRSCINNVARTTPTRSSASDLSVCPLTFRARDRHSLPPIVSSKPPIALWLLTRLAFHVHLP